MLEFTGERVVPGLVDPNLLNEHLARYRFAARYSAGARVLDAGCGSGYGTRELASAASVVAMDISRDALVHAAQGYARPGLVFAQGRLEALPFADGAFDLVLAYEVIEHLEHWEEMLREARRVLRPAGILLVSTPNKSYYTESRGAAGANPFHEHEFEYEEFRTALERFFPHVRMWSQNRTEAIVFVPLQASEGTLDAAGDSAPGDAHFYLAACSAEPIAEGGAYGWLPRAGNLLRERERHIELLFQEIERRKAFAAELEESRATMMSSHAAVEQQLGRANQWAESLNARLQESGERIDALQSEVAAVNAGYQERIRIMAEEDASRLRWIADLESQIESGNTEIERLHAENLRLKRTIEERAEQAEKLGEELTGVRAELAYLQGILSEVAQSKWFRAGRAIHLGPSIDGSANGAK